MSKRGQLLSLLVLLVLGIITALQYINVRGFDQDKILRVHLLIQQIKAADTQTEQDMLEIYNHMLLSDDELTEQAALQWTLFHRLSSELATDDVSDELAALKGSLNIQHKAINRFKSSISILINSERSLPELAKQLAAEHPDHAPLLRDISLSLMRWVTIPDMAKKAELQQEISAIQTLGFPVLAKHAHILIKELESSRNAIDIATHCGTPENLNILSQVFYQRDSERFASYRQKTTWLLVLIVLLITGFAYLAWMNYHNARRILSDNQMQQSVNTLLTIAEDALADRLQRALECVLTQPWLGMEARGAIFLIENKHLVMTASSNMGDIAERCATLPLGECLCGKAALSGQSVISQHVDYQHTCSLSGEDKQAHYIMPLSADNAALGVLHLYLPSVAYDLSSSEQTFLDTTVNILGQIIEKEASQTTMRRLEIAIEQISDAVFITNNEGVIVYANPQCEQVYNMPLQSICGSLAAHLRGGKKDDVLYQKIVSAMNAGQPWEGEIVLKNEKNGERKFRRIVSPVLVHHKVGWHVCVDHDITTERKVQSRIEHGERLESLGVLAGGIAHDFNNILTAILGNAALAERNLLKKPQNMQQYLNNIVISSERAADLCKQMLAYSGKGKFVVKAINLSTMVEEITQLLEVSIAKGVIIEYHFGKHLPAVDTDVTQMQQVIMNLVINASDAIGDQSGIISIATGVIQADKAYLTRTSLDDQISEGSYVYLEVSDTGCGMDKATQEKLFEPFFTTKFTGHGLGMSAVLGIVHGHQGAIKIDSEKGKGSTFTVLLPVSKQQIESITEPTESTDLSGNLGTILIIDDEHLICETAAMILEHIGFETLTAKDGEDGIRVYREHQHNVAAVLLDMTMPRMDGKTCFTELQRINPDVKVVLSSGYSEQEATNQFTGQGLAGFIQKPYRPGDLQRKMQKILAE
ncbi:MAG: response regulator [Mariprofundaceae bacterium]|nr:response regulator [Mariprofundaceae bacterium]